MVAPFMLHNLLCVEIYVTAIASLSEITTNLSHSMIQLFEDNYFNFLIPPPCGPFTLTS